MAKDHYLEDLFGAMPEPGVFSGICTLVGGVLGAGLVAVLFFYGTGDGGIAGLNPIVAVAFGLLFAFLLAAFTFLIGWILEITWPLLGLLILIGVVMIAPFALYFGFDQFGDVFLSLGNTISL